MSAAAPLCAACGAGVSCWVHDQPALDPQPGSTVVLVVELPDLDASTRPRRRQVTR
ncbi:hypothetical protein JNW90_24290 [Micromonospora sp. STR1s_5]|nr:hypothetical protein [Micromonospora sp. STR1s_5]